MMEPHDLYPGMPGYFEHAAGFWLLTIALTIMVFAAQQNNKFIGCVAGCIALVALQFLNIRDNLIVSSYPPPCE